MLSLGPMADRRATRLSRRVFLRRAAVTPALALWSGCNFDRGQPSVLADGGADMDGAIDAATTSSEFEPCTPVLTPVDQFPAIFGGDGMVSDWTMPTLDAQEHALAIDGLVERPLSFRLDELEAETEGVISVINSLQCAFGPTGTQVWTGLPLRDLLDRTGPDLQRARRLRLYGADGYRDNLQLEDIYVADESSELFAPMLAYRIGGRPLPEGLGFPFRLLLGDRYGYKNVKWLERIELTEDDSSFGMYEDDKFDPSLDAGRMGVTGALEAPRPPERFTPGPLQICGRAMSGATGIDRVEISINDGAPLVADLLSRNGFLSHLPAAGETLQAQQPARFPYPWRGVWTPFSHDWQAEPGIHQLRMHVIDRNGTINDRVSIEVEVAVS